MWYQGFLLHNKNGEANAAQGSHLPWLDRTLRASLLNRGELPQEVKERGLRELIEEFMSQEKFAIVGASDNPEKYGNEILHDLKSRGYKVYPVNPRLEEIDGMKCYSSLSDLPVTVDVVDLVVPPQVTEKVIRECKHLRLKRIWMQPGSESQEAIDFCDANGLSVVHDMCVMMNGPNVKKQSSEGEEE